MQQPEIEENPQLPNEDAQVDESEHIVMQALTSDHGQRLDKVLSSHIASVSRSFLTQLVQQQAVKVGGNCYQTITKTARWRRHRSPYASDPASHGIHGPRCAA